SSLFRMMRIVARARALLRGAERADAFEHLRAARRVRNVLGAELEGAGGFRRAIAEERTLVVGTGHVADIDVRSCGDEADLAVQEVRAGDGALVEADVGAGERPVEPGNATLDVAAAADEIGGEIG